MTHIEELLETQETEPLLKKYAARYLYHGDPYKAAFDLFNYKSDELALTCGRKWPYHPVVIEELERLRTSRDSLKTLPNEFDVRNELWKRLTTRTVEDKDFINGMRLYAELGGFIKKNNEIDHNNVPVSKVILIREVASVAEWENKATNQQKELLNVARTRN